MSARERRAKSRRQQRRGTTRRAILPVAVSGALATTTALGLAGELSTANAANLTASQVADINPGPASSYPQDQTDVGGTLYFTANDGTHGAELWKSDGTSAGTVQVADINPGSGNSYPQDLTDVNGTLYFTANDGTHGAELWKSDGTSAGTVQVADINPGSGSYPGGLTDVGGTLYFFANDGTHGTELWTSDGTSAGTVQVADINPGSGSSNAHDLTDVNGTLYFTASDGTHGTELWTSDGTSAGTVQVADINPGSGSSNPADLTDVGGTLYFFANDGTHGTELWKLGPAPPGGGGGGGGSGQAGTTTGSPSSSRDPSVAGQPVTFTVTISPIPDGGTVKFTDPGVTIPGCGAVPVNTTTGEASCTTTFNRPGSYQIQTIYSGDGSFTGSQSPVMTQVVTRKPSAKPAHTSLRLRSSASSVWVGRQVTYTAHVTPDPNGGRVSFLDNGHMIAGCGNVPVNAKGTARCKWTYSRSGVHIIQAGYAGTARFANSAAKKLTETVKRRRTKKHR